MPRPTRVPRSTAPRASISPPWSPLPLLSRGRSREAILRAAPLHVDEQRFDRLVLDLELGLRGRALRSTVVALTFDHGLAEAQVESRDRRSCPRSGAGHRRHPGSPARPGSRGSDPRRRRPLPAPSPPPGRRWRRTTWCPACFQSRGSCTSPRATCRARNAGRASCPWDPIALRRTRWCCRSNGWRCSGCTAPTARRVRPRQDPAARPWRA